METVNVAMIGTGHAHAKGIMAELKQYRNYTSGKLFNVVCYVDEKENSDSVFHDVTFKTYKDFDNEWKKMGLHALIIETEMDELIETAGKYLDMCGLPMHIDKPTGCDNEFIKFMDIAENKKVPVSLGYMYRFNPAVIETRRILDEKIGNVFQINSNMNFDGGDKTRKDMESYPGGGLYVYGSHMLDLVFWFMGNPDKLHVIKKSVDTSVSKCCDNGLAVLEYPNGTGIINVNLAAGNGYNQRSITVCGDKGCVEIHPMEIGQPDGLNDLSSKEKNAVLSDIMRISVRERDQADKDTSQKVDLSKDYVFDRRYLYMMKNFAYMVMGQKEKIYFDCNYTYEKELHNLLLEMIK